jgi:arsenate reductase
MGAVTRTPPLEPVALWRRLAAEFLGSGFLAAIVICSGIAAQHLSPGATGLELLENAAATARPRRRPVSPASSRTGKPA